MYDSLNQQKMVLTPLLNDEGIVLGNVRDSAVFESEPTSTLRHFMAERYRIYRFSCLCGIIRPFKEENKASSITSVNLRFRLWSLFLHADLMLLIVAYIIFSISFLVNPSSFGESLVVGCCVTFGVLFQLLLLPPLIYCIRQAIDLDRNIKAAFIEEAFDYSIYIAWYLLFFLMAMSLYFPLYMCFTLQLNHYQVISSIVVQICCVAPLNFFFAGVVSFLVMEQRISYFALKEMDDLITTERLTTTHYFDIRHALSDRTRETPINLLTGTAAFNTLVLLLLIVEFKQSSSANETAKMIGFVLSLFGRQTVALFIFLYQVLKVNGIADSYGKKISLLRWQPENEINRLALYACFKEHPIGTKIFLIRPSKFSILLQLFSTSMGLILAIFWSFVL